VIAAGFCMSPENLTVDRRDVAMREALLNKLRSEIRHVPGLALTPDQASRLFDVPREICGRLLDSLAKQGVIQVRPDGRFIALAGPNRPEA
jgi:hypothetical protein